MSVRGKPPGQIRLLDGVGTWVDSDMQGGPVDEFLGVTVEEKSLTPLDGTWPSIVHPCRILARRIERHERRIC